MSAFAQETRLARAQSVHNGPIQTRSRAAIGSVLQLRHTVGGERAASVSRFEELDDDDDERF
jgi:hypothetical protein